MSKDGVGKFNPCLQPYMAALQQSTFKLAWLLWQRKHHIDFSFVYVDLFQIHRDAFQRDGNMFEMSLHWKWLPLQRPNLFYQAYFNSGIQGHLDRTTAGRGYSRSKANLA